MRNGRLHRRKHNALRRSSGNKYNRRVGRGFHGTSSERRSIFKDESTKVDSNVSCCLPHRDTTLDVSFLCPVHGVPSFMTSESGRENVVTPDWKDEIYDEGYLFVTRNYEYLIGAESFEEGGNMGAEVNHNFHLSSESWFNRKQFEGAINQRDLLSVKGNELYRNLSGGTYERVSFKVQWIIGCRCTC